MKNIFKLMGIALLGCSMLVACGNDEEETKIPDGATVKFDGQTYDENAFATKSYSYFANYGAISAALHAGTAMQNIEDFCPGFEMGVASTETGTLTGECNAEGKFPESKIAYCEFYKNTVLKSNDAYYGDFWAKTVNMELKAIDLTALTYTATLNGTMFDAKAAFVDQAGVAAASTAAFEATFGNVTMTAAK